MCCRIMRMSSTILCQIVDVRLPTNYEIWPWWDQWDQSPRKPTNKSIYLEIIVVKPMKLTLRFTFFELYIIEKQFISEVCEIFHLETTIHGIRSDPSQWGLMNVVASFVACWNSSLLRPGWSSMLLETIIFLLNYLEFLLEYRMSTE